MKTTSINLITLGCSKNTVDSEYLLKQLDANGFKILHNNDQANTDIVIINTCAFINDAREESINTILKYVGLKNRGVIRQLLVTGCLPQKYTEVLKKEIPEVDFFSGVNSLPSILAQLGCQVHGELLSHRILTGPEHYAYLKISEGCNRRCAFCSIPGIRGKHISRPIDAILRETDLLAEKKVKEIILIAQDLNYYGIDLYGKRMLPRLIENILKKNHFEWIRLQYLYPAGLSEALLDIIKNNKHVCNYIDIPIQHITDKMLKFMKRGYTRYSLEKLLWKIRDKIPEAAIRTTIIAGHPGETKKDFEELKKFVSDFRFERLGIFRYSHEEGTYAYRHCKDTISEKEKQFRAAALMDIQQGISLAANKNRINKMLKVIIDRREGGYFIGRTEFDSPEVDHEVLIEEKYKILTGQFYNVRITDASEFDLFGVPVK